MGSSESLPREERLVLRRKFYKPWKRVVDNEVVIEQVRRSVQRVIEDPRTRLLEAEPEPDATQLVVVTGAIKSEHYKRAVDKILLPRNVNTIFAPSNAKSVFAVRFFPAHRIKSINGLWRLRESARSLPDSIIQDALARIWPTVQRTAEFAGVTPETLLTGK